MTRDEFNAFCATLPAATHVVQWGGSDVWKIGGKVFAIAGLGHGGKAPGITFKVSRLAYEILNDRRGLRPAPYLGSRGFSWIQHFAAPGLDDAELRAHIQASYNLVGNALTRKARAALGFP